MNKQFFVLFSMVLLFLFAANLFSDNVSPSTSPPGGLNPDNVPQFVNIGFDDNACDDAMIWLGDLLRDKTNPAGNGNHLNYDGSPARVVYYVTSNYGAWMKSLWGVAKNDGHEFGNHSVNHDNTANWGYDQWKSEIDSCNSYLKINLGMTDDDLWGFRTPFLLYNSNTFSAMVDAGLIYDCTLNANSASQNGSSYYWPYTMDGGSPGDPGAGTHPGFWEVPTHQVVLTSGGKQTGLDYNMWVNSGLGGSAMTKSTFAATLKNTLDLRYNGNRAPFTFGAHSDYYSQNNDAANDACPNASWQDRREGLQDFIEYALSKPDVRMVTSINIIKWMRDPIGLDQTPIALSDASKQVVNLTLNTVSPSRIEFSIPRAGTYTLSLYAMNGKTIATFARGYYSKGVHGVSWNREDFSTGTYLIRLKGMKNEAVKRVTVF